MGGYRQKKRCRLSLIHLLWCWPSRPFMFKHLGRAAVKDLGRVLEWVGSASLLQMFVMAIPIAPTVEMKRTATEAAVVVVKIVVAAAVAAASMMASVATDSLAITSSLIPNLRATSWEDPTPKEDPSRGR